LMRGYVHNRLIDRSALVARLQYAWPIWVYLDGVIHADVGNVFGPHFEGFEAGLLRLTSGIGIRSNGARDSGFELLVAGGADPFKDGPARVSCVPEDYESSFAWDAADNSIFRPISMFFAVSPGGEALNVNAFDEVPDSSWFVNRIGVTPLSAEDAARGYCPE